ncbi:Histone acetyltransferase like protein [Verticillium longisporum]|uniref:histone acetyltransferase n=1 Tax=Verticillium longisporum TaxID=100787 RepID=A0A8I2ZMZ3_VERLO|nr:Histone acetyltransferase like protein [Verticillium longisporum]KAG7134925.1 Histone acetyltransferase like protein [Verticillium longisporum]
MSAIPAKLAPGKPLLVERLSRVLPKDLAFGIYHLSTPPTKTDALFSAPPNEHEDRTYCENHFLAVTVDATNSTSTANGGDHGSPRVLAFAIEIFIFTTAYTSTFFVSKADSTGYLALLGLPKGTPSPIKEVCGAFMSYLVEQRQRKDKQCIVSLFARAQDQYLFPGSIKNKTKHVLDDRGLVKWWCRVLNPLLASPPAGDWAGTKAYLVIPGLDAYETKAFLPRTENAAAHWELGHPLERISHYTREYDWVPPRCLIPKYPDDPKSRYRDELDEESAKSKQLQTTGMWKSIRSLDQFWEMLAYRQECSSGRLTGFIWVVFDPKNGEQKADAPASFPTPSASFSTPSTSEPPSTPSKQRTTSTANLLLTPRKLFPTTESADAASKAKSENKAKKKKQPLRGIIKTRQPNIKTQRRNQFKDRKISTAYYYWPLEGRGQRVVEESAYKRSIELLLHLDFANLDLAKGSTRRWVSEVGMGEPWGLEVTGQRDVSVVDHAASATATGTVNNLSGMVKRKRAPAIEGNGDQPAKINVLSAGLVRKKPTA